MGDLTIEDLVPDDTAEKAAQDAAETAAENAEPVGEWAYRLVNDLKDDGLFLPLLFGEDYLPDAQNAAQAPQQDATTDMTENANPDDGAAQDAAQAAEIDAETVVQICDGVIEQAGDVQISQIKALAENKPEMVDNMIENHL